MGSHKPRARWKGGTAGIFPLEYSKDRVEHSIVYVGPEWNELYDVLVDPVAWVRHKQFAFEQDPGGEIDWNLKTPVTAVIEPIGAKPTGAIKDARLVAEVLGGENVLGSQGLMINSVVSREQAFQRAFPDGLFIAEFAVDTRVLSIRYSPPTDAGTAWYSGKIHTPTLAVLSPGIADLHFDIDSCPAAGQPPFPDGYRFRQRAQLLMDCLEEPQRLVSMLNKEPMFVQNGAFAAEGSPIKPATSMGAASKPKVPIDYDRASMGSLSIVVDGLSDWSESTCCVCIICCLYRMLHNGKDHWWICNCEYKNYCPCIC